MANENQSALPAESERCVATTTLKEEQPKTLIWIKATRETRTARGSLYIRRLLFRSRWSPARQRCPPFSSCPLMTERGHQPSISAALGANCSYRPNKNLISSIVEALAGVSGLRDRDRLALLKTSK